MFDKYIEKAIREHCKNTDFLSDIKSIKLLTMKYRETVACWQGITLIKFDVVCSCKDEKYGHSHVKFQVNIYDNPNGTKENTISVFFDGFC